MKFIIQNHIYFKIINEITTPTGRKSETQNCKYFYIIHRLNHIRLHEPDEYKFGVPMNYKILEKILMMPTGRIRKILKWLINNDVIVKIKNYSVGHHSSLYKLHPEVETMLIDTLDVLDSESRMVQKIKLFNSATSMNCVVTAHQLSLINTLTVNQQGRNYLKEKYGELEELVEIVYSVVDPKDYVLLSIYLKDVYCRRNEHTERAYSSLTSIPSYQRDYLSLRDASLHQIDLKNAQILLSIPKIIRAFQQLHGNHTMIPVDVQHFKELAENGCFYEYMATKIGLDITAEKSRGAFKERFFKEIFYSKIGKHKTKLKAAFELEFPHVIEAINFIKVNDYRLFAVELQRFEASIFIDVVLRDLYSLGIDALSIHDSIVTTNAEDLILAERYITSALLKYGLKPTFKKSGGSLFNVAA